MGDKTYRVLWKEFKQKVNKLQEDCKHTRLTNWMDSVWAVGHSTGNRVRFCKRCNKVISKQYCVRNCIKCKKNFSIYLANCPHCIGVKSTPCRVYEHKGKIVRQVKIRSRKNITQQEVKK